jgi:hypothetical protein
MVGGSEKHGLRIMIWGPAERGTENDRLSTTALCSAEQTSASEGLTGANNSVRLTRQNQALVWPRERRWNLNTSWRMFGTVAVVPLPPSMS